MQAYEVPQASASAVLGVDYSATLQASNTPLLLLPMPACASGDAPLQAQHAAVAAPKPSCVFSSPSAAQSHHSPSRQVSASQEEQREQAGASCEAPGVSPQCAEPPTAAPEQTGRAGGGTPHAGHQRFAAAAQRSRPGTGGGIGRREERKMPCVLLVPCCEAVHGRFPLNGTYFQTNEVFLNAATLQRPIMASPPPRTNLTSNM